MNIEKSMDPELRAVFTKLPELPKATSTEEFVAARKSISEMIAAMQVGQPKSDRVMVEDRCVPSPTGSPEVPIRIYTPSSRTEALPGLLYIHGGGFTAGSAKDFDFNCEHIVENVGCVVVSVDYRLAPEHPFPAGPEDCYTTLRWMVASAVDLGVNAASIAVGGASAGGGLAAAVALMARDRKEVKLAFQWLLYGCLDDRHITPSSHAITDMRVWNRAKSLSGWKAYLGSDHQGEVSPYAAPTRMEDLSSLPPAYIMVGELDLMRDENIEYATRLMQAGVSTELHVIPGAFHGFEFLVPNAAVSIRARSECTEALKYALSRWQVQDQA